MRVFKILAVFSVLMSLLILTVPEFHRSSAFAESNQGGRIEKISRDQVAVSGDQQNDTMPQAERGEQLDKAFQLAIMHINDSHAHVEQFPRLFTAVKTIRREHSHSLLVHAGDVFSGTLYFLKYMGQADLHFLNQLPLDALTLGNHEFDKGSEPLANFIKNAKFPIVAANVNVENEPVLRPFFTNEIGRPGQKGKSYPAIIKEFGEEKVAIIGLTTKDTTFLSSPSEGIKFENPTEKAQQTIDHLTAQGVNKIIVLSHLGYNADKKLAKKVKGIDVIVGGHSHTILEEPEVIGKDEPTLIVQTGEHLKNLGVLEVTFDQNGVITSHNGKLLSLKSFPKDQLAAKHLREFQKPLDELAKKVVGITNVHLNGKRREIRRKETNLGNVIADAMLDNANEYVKTDIALQDSGSIRASIKEGEITLGQVLTVLPFENTLVVFHLTGEEIWQALENSVSQAEKGKGKFAQVAGLRFKYDPQKPPGQRVWQVEVKSNNGYEVLDLNETYAVATNGFIGEGRSGYDMFKKAREEGRMTELFIADFEALTSYFEKTLPVEAEVEGRIIKEAKPADTSARISPDKLVIKEVTDQSVFVSGQAAADSVVEVKIGEESYAGETDENGLFNIFIPQQKPGTLISVITLDPNGEGIPANIIVKDGTAPEPPVVDEIYANSKDVTGTSETFALITVRIGDKIFVGKADKNGSFKIKIPPQKKGTIIEVTATDKAGNESEPTANKVTSNRDSLSSINNYLDNTGTDCRSCFFIEKLANALFYYKKTLIVVS